MHTPIQRHQAIISFSRDHHFGLLLVWKIRQGLKNGINAERISNYILYVFKADLEHHFREEEQLLFNKLPADDALRKRAEADHHILYGLIAALTDDKTDTAQLSRFADELEKHIRFEERVLFNYMQENIDKDDLEQIAHRIANNSRAIDEEWKDMFWVNSPIG